MSHPDDALILYKVVYSERVREELKRLLTRATAQGIGKPILDVVKSIDARLKIFPQFGEPLRDLIVEGQTEWIGTVPPLVVRYILDEERKQVYVVIPLLSLSGKVP